MITRRELLALASASAILPAEAEDRQAAGAGPPRIGLITTTTSTFPGNAAFRDALQKLGYVEGQSIHIEPRFAAGKLDKLADFATELADLKVDLIAAIGDVSVRAVRQVTTSIPIVFTIVLDPVKVGLVSNAERPGGNITGATDFDPAQPRAQMRLLKQIVPGLERVAILDDARLRQPAFLGDANTEGAEAEGLRPQRIRMQGTTEDMDAVFAAIKDERAGAVLALEVPAVGVHAKQIIALSNAARLPLMFPADAFFYSPMLAYGSSLLEAVRRMAGQANRILKGAQAGDLPIEVVTEHKLYVDLRQARAAGVTIPPEVLGRADKVIA